MKIHPSAIVHPEAQIDETAEIGPFCIIGAHVRIGARTRLMSHVSIEGWTSLGEDNIVFPFAVLGAVPQDLKYRGEKTELIIGNRNTIRESVTMNLGTAGGGGKTVLGDDNLVMAYVHFGHDTQVGNHCVIANSVNLAGHVTVEDYAIIGGTCAVSQFVRVGAHSYIGGFSGLERDVPPFVIAVGTRPTVVKGTNIVGLRRRGVPTETIQKINEAIKLWVRPDVQKEQCCLEIESQYSEVPEVRQFVAFIRASEAGVTRAS